MTATLWVDPDHLRSVAPRFDQLADTAGRLRARLVDGLDAEGVSWGNDEGGDVFATDYVPASESAVEAITTLLGVLTGIGDRLRETAGAFEGTDIQFAQRLDGHL
ncbi:MAG: type VII secretion target [Rhodococcus sp. (in: high G+C Gram-positive bacteria)]|uniref:type VII secretion target n=1 Tax=Rhodococcus sp. TaxID=1831 RepID=UPI003BB05821